MEKIKVLIVDDEKLIREGLKIILSSYDQLELVGLCGDGYQALDFCRQNPVDVVLMDIRMPECDGVLATRIIKEEFHHIKILILTTFSDMDYIEEALKHGASGYLLKDSSYDLIYQGIKAASKGNIVVHPQIANKMLSNISRSRRKMDKLEPYDLTKREITIIKGIASGMSNREIAEQLYLSEGTVKNNISNILSKLNLRDRTQVAIFAFKSDLIE